MSVLRSHTLLSYLVISSALVLSARGETDQVSYTGCQVYSVFLRDENDLAALTNFQAEAEPTRVSIWTESPEKLGLVEVMVCPEAKAAFRDLVKMQGLILKEDGLVDVQNAIDLEAAAQEERVKTTKCKSWRCRTTTLPPITSSTAPPTSATTAPPTSATTAPPTSATTAPPTSATTAPPTSATVSPPDPAARHPSITTYQRLAGFNTIFSDLQSQYPNLINVSTVGNSLEGRETPLVVLSDGTPGKRAVYLDSLIHAREWITGATMLYIIDRIVKSYGTTDTEADNLLRTYDWYIVPIVNPDGYEYTFTNDRMWRKNRRNVGRRCTGIDLNRNFDANFGGTGSSGSCSSETYRGTAAFSEPETDNLRQFFVDHPLDWAFSMSIHSYSQLWLHPSGYTTNPVPNKAELERVGTAAVNAIQAESGLVFELGDPGSILYLVSGSTIDYLYDKVAKPYGTHLTYSPECRPANSNQGGFILPADQILPSGEEIFAAIVATVNAIEAGP